MVDFDALVLAPAIATFGEVVTYTPKNRLGQGIAGVFDRAYLELLPMGGARGQEPMAFGAAGNVTDRKPILGVRLADFMFPPAQGDTVFLPGRGLLFTVKEVQPDGQGGAKLVLMKA